MGARAALVVSIATSAVACGGAVATDPSSTSTGVAGAPNPPPPPASSEPAIDYSIEPNTKEEAFVMCRTPPRDWEDVLDPSEETITKERWVMCQPRQWVMSFGTDHQMVVEGQPYTTWDWGLVLPEKKTLVIPFPLDANGGFGIARGVPQRARGGYDHWLHLAVDPRESGTLAPQLGGETQAIFLRIHQ
jgi:hypothetical protein